MGFNSEKIIQVKLLRFTSINNLFKFLYKFKSDKFTKSLESIDYFINYNDYKFPYIY